MYNSDTWGEVMKRLEVIFSYVIGAYLIFLGIVSLIKHENITIYHEKGVFSQATPTIKNGLDLFNAFFDEIEMILGQSIGGFPILFSIIVFILGLLFIYFGRLLKKTTDYDKPLMMTYFVFSFIFVMMTTLLMTVVYSYLAWLFFVFFILLGLYFTYKHRLNPENNKVHYFLLLIMFMIAYVSTQHYVYQVLDQDVFTPFDVLSINIFFTVLTALSFMSLYVALYLKKSLMPWGYVDSNEEVLSRRLKRQKRGPIDSNKVYLFDPLHDVLTKLNPIRLFEDDPWFRWPSWLKVTYIELFLGMIMLIFVGIEFNNRNGLLISGDFKISQLNMIYEWLNLFVLLCGVLLYIIVTVMNILKDRYGAIQFVLIFLITLKLFTSLSIKLFQDVELAQLILPINLLLCIISIPMLLINLSKNY